MSRKTMGVLIVLLVGLLLSGLGDREELSLAQGGDGPSPQAVITPLLQYQGRLSDPDTGEPMDGVYAMSFRLYNVEAGGAPLWTETEDVPVQGGLFSNALGDSTPLGLSLFNGQALWLGIKVGTDPEAVPRQPVLPVAYALSLVPGAVVGGPMQVAGDLDVTGSLTGPHAGDPDAHHVRYTDAEAWNTVLANDGPFSGLNADLLDGLDSGSFALSSHLHDGGHIQSGTIAEKYIDPVIARDPEVAASYAPISHLHDGGAIQSGTIAEKYIDPVIARDSEVESAIISHNHDARYYTESESNTYFVNASGDTMSGALTVPQVRYSSPRTHYFSISSEAFFPANNVDYGNASGCGGAYLAAGTGRLVAPVHLPHGAVVTRFTVFFLDTSAADMEVELQHQSLTGCGWAVLAEVFSSGSSGYYSLVDTTIANATIDNTIYGYSIDAYSTGWSSSLMIKGAVIQYTVTEAP